jgi:hypothetical protein
MASKVTTVENGNMISESGRKAIKTKERRKSLEEKSVGRMRAGGMCP